MKMVNHAEQEVVDQAAMVVLVPVKVEQAAMVVLVPVKVEQAVMVVLVQVKVDQAAMVVLVPVKMVLERVEVQDLERAAKTVVLSMDASLSAHSEIITVIQRTAQSLFSVHLMDHKKCHAVLELDGTKIS